MPTSRRAFLAATAGAALSVTATARPARPHAAEGGAGDATEDRPAATAPADGAANGGCAFPPLGEIKYHVLREGATFGEHVARFTRDGDDFVARNDIEIVARLLGIPVYRYTHWSEEVWRDGLLMELRSGTNKDGKKDEVRGERKNGVLKVRGDGKTHALPGFVLTTSLWHGRTPEAETLLDIEDADLREVAGRFVGEEQVKVAGKPQPAQHYLLSEDMKRDIWYGADCRLLRVGFNTKKDGSRIELQPYRIADA